MAPSIRGGGATRSAKLASAAMRHHRIDAWAVATGGFPRTRPAAWSGPGLLVSTWSRLSCERAPARGECAPQRRDLTWTSNPLPTVRGAQKGTGLDAGHDRRWTGA